MRPALSATVTGVFVGAVRERWPGRPPSAIGKVAVAGRQMVTRTGLTGDAQADLTVHGGPGKAVHHYPGEHHAAWSAELGERAVFRPGGFGENLTSVGLTEAEVCIGDVFRFGTAVLQVSQGRQPCWKLVAHTGVEEMAYLVRKTLRTGWYYRVLTEGVAGPGDALVLTDRPHQGFTVRRVAGAVMAARVDRGEAARIAGLAALDEGWRAAVLARVAG
jgi:MOSC domain-containing protein YiiM